MTPYQGPGACKVCGQFSRALSSGYCPPCHDLQQEAREEWDERQRELDRESAESYAEYDLKGDDDD
jgi:hypothetical protein